MDTNPIINLESAADQVMYFGTTDYLQSEWRTLTSLINEMSMGTELAFDELQKSGVRDVHGNWCSFLLNHGAVITLSFEKLLNRKSSVKRAYTIDLLSPDGVEYIKTVLTAGLWG